MITTGTVARAIGAYDAWEVSTGRGVAIAIIDSGVRDETPGLKGKVVERHDLVKDPQYNPHGTCVAEIAAGREVAEGDATFVGIAPDAEIVDIRVVDHSGHASYFTILRGLEIAIENPRVKIINMSLGAPISCCGSTLADLFEIAAQRGKIVVVAAGNFGPKPWSVACPGGLRSCVSVGCICCEVDHNHVAWFSARGPGCGGVIKPDVSAYGGCGDLYGRVQPIELIAVPYLDKIVAARGTSFSAPVVSGFAALLAQTKPDIDLAGFNEVVSQTSDDLGPHGKDNDYGWGLVDPQMAISMIERVPLPKIRREIKRKGIAGIAVVAALAGMVILASRR